jgi:hypothetical protein
MITFNAIGIKDVQDKLNKLSDEKRYQSGLEKVVIQAWIYAKSYAPEMTGKLMESIRFQKETPHSYFLIADPRDERGKGYAIYNEYGSVYTPAGTPDSPIGAMSTSGKYAFRPFMRPAVIKAIGKAKNIFWSEIF